MGRIDIPGYTFFKRLGWDVIIPPPITKKTIELGSRYAPEFACFPLKINLGNMIEALELGAEVIFMAGGHGPCRFGYYGEVEKTILKDLGYNFEFYVFEPYAGRFKKFFQPICQLFKYEKNLLKIYNAGKIAWEQGKAIDVITKSVYRIWPREEIPGTTKRLYQSAIAKIKKADSVSTIRYIVDDTLKQLGEIKIKKETPLKVALVGEIYAVLEPYMNFNLEDFLSDRGVEVTRTIYITDWAEEQLIPKKIRQKKKIGHHEESKRFACGYLDHFVGGHGIETVGTAVKYAQAGYDGVIQVLPFTCMPEIVAQSILPSISRDYEIPILTIIIDEHSGQAGLITRLEAFIDLLQWKRSKKEVC
jgi:predicted nucleotide-binding protein (sugar kinase/HSP70/actin superfamily)